MNNMVTKSDPITEVYAYPQGSFDAGPLLDRPEYASALEESSRRTNINKRIERKNFWRDLLFGLPALPTLETSPFRIYQTINNSA